MISTSAKMFCATALVALGALPVSAQSAADFYKGKTSRSSSASAWAAATISSPRVSRHLGKYLPGQSDRRGAEHGGRRQRARRQLCLCGIAAGRHRDRRRQPERSRYTSSSAAPAPATRRRTLQWLGSMTNSNGTVYTWHTSGIKTLDDAKTKEVPMGAVGVAIGFGDLPESDERDARHQVQADHRLCRAQDANPSRDGARRGSWAAAATASRTSRPPMRAGSRRTRSTCWCRSVS